MRSYQMMCVSIVTLGGFLLLSSSLGYGQERPLAPWGVHAVVTAGRTTYEGEKLRAILVYGETGNPQLTIERIHVEMGYPSPNRVLWATKVDITGGRPSPCPIAENYCAIVVNLRWSDETLHYDLVSPSAVLRCRVDKITSRAPSTTCNSK